MQAPYQKVAVVGLLLIPEQVDQEVFKFGSSTGGSGFSFEMLDKIRTEHVSCAVTGNIPSSSKAKTGTKTAIEDAEDDVDDLPDSDFSKTAATVLGEIDNAPVTYTR